MRKDIKVSVCNDFDYKDWVIKQGAFNDKIVLIALEQFYNDIPEHFTPNISHPVAKLFLHISEIISIDETTRSKLLDLMLYCEGEDTFCEHEYSRKGFISVLT